MTDMALTTQQQVETALAFSETRDKLLALVAGSKAIVEITNADGYKECHAARMALKTTRIEIQKRGKEARDDAVKFQKAVIAKEKELVEIIEPEEARLQELQDAIDDAKAREKAAREQAERDRIDALNKRFDDIRRLPLGAMNATVADIDALIAQAEGIDVASFPADNHAAATYEIRLALASLRAARDARVAQDAEQAKIEADRIELAKVREQLAAAQAEAERAAAAERERQAAEARRAEEAARAQREAEERAARLAREAEQARIDAERAEKQRQEDEERAAAAEAVRVQQEALAREREALAQQAAEREAEAKRKAEAEAVERETRKAAEHAARVARHGLPAVEMVAGVAYDAWRQEPGQWALTKPNGIERETWTRIALAVLDAIGERADA